MYPDITTYSSGPLGSGALPSVHVPDDSGMDEVRVDVLIIGGGAQGLWLLNDLTDKSYSAMLVERDRLGAGQTGHAHAVMHYGAYYSDVAMMRRLNSAATYWTSFINRTGLRPVTGQPGFAGFGPGLCARKHQLLWDEAGLTYRRARSVPPILQGGEIAALYEVKEYGLNASDLVTAMARDVKHLIYKLDDVAEPLRFIRAGNRVVTVALSIGGRWTRVRPAYVFLVAGEGNLDLLHQMGLDRDPHRGSPVLVQARRKSQMLVLRGPHLPTLAAVFPIASGLQGAFIASRPDPEVGGSAWLVSDHHATPFTAGASPDIEPGWVQNLLGTLRRVAPRALHTSPLGTLWASAYTGVTSERNFGAGAHGTDYYLESFGMENLTAIWPTKLTFTPAASDAALRRVHEVIPIGSGPWHPTSRPIQGPTPAVAPEFWTRAEVRGPSCYKTPWLTFGEFVERFGSPSRPLNG